MLDPSKIYEVLRACGVDFFTGVPDSLLKEFCTCVSDLSEPNKHIIAANEGGSVALAAGHYLATGKCALVYLQNSGLGNVVNPILSLADPSVYAVPMLMMVGWRGEPGTKDEPQHVRQGEVTLAMLDVLGVPYYILPDDTEGAAHYVAQAHAQAVDESRPVALVVKKGAFNVYESRSEVMRPCGKLTREQALKIILKMIGTDDVVVATTGKTSREVYELREKYAPNMHRQDFLTVGSMGHCSQIVLGMSLAQPDRKIVCLDGDGAALMHMGGMAIIGQSEAQKLLHIVLNNGAHESVGGQPTVALGLDMPMLAKAMGYKVAMSCQNAKGLSDALQGLTDAMGPVLLEIKICMGSRDDLGRPALTPLENKNALMQHLGSAQ